jgi:hypothetical protein
MTHSSEQPHVHLVTRGAYADSTPLAAFEDRTEAETFADWWTLRDLRTGDSGLRAPEDGASVTATVPVYMAGAWHADRYGERSPAAEGSAVNPPAMPDVVGTEAQPGNITRQEVDQLAHDINFHAGAAGADPALVARMLPLFLASVGARLAPVTPAPKASPRPTAPGLATRDGGCVETRPERGDCVGELFMLTQLGTKLGQPAGWTVVMCDSHSRLAQRHVEVIPNMRRRYDANAS